MNQLEQISYHIKSQIIDLYNRYNTKYNEESHDRITELVTHAIVADADIPMIKKLQIYYAALLYITNNISFYRYDYGHVREILDGIDLPGFIVDKNEFIEGVVEIINITTTPQNPKTNPWDGIIKDAISIDRISPSALYRDAIRLKRNGIPLYTRFTVQIRYKNSMKGICHKSKKYNSFMEYIYHVKLHEMGSVISENSYLDNMAETNKNHMIDLCLLFGDRGSISFGDLREWAGINIDEI